MSSERRASTRVRVGLQVIVRWEHRSVHGTATEISRRGIFIELCDVVPLGQVVSLVIRAELLATPVSLQGTVVHHLAGVGIGVQFADRTELTAKRIAQLKALIVDPE
jgi:hypothetical protein